MCRQRLVKQVGDFTLFRLWHGVLFSNLAKRERIGLDAWIEKLDLEQSISDRLRLSDQLVQPLFIHSAVALVVNVDAMRCARRLSINAQAKSHRRAWCRRP